MGKKANINVRLDYSFNLSSETELMKVFRQKDRKKVFLPKGVKFPLETTYYHTWTEPSGVYMYLIFKKPQWQNPIGVVFNRSDHGSLASKSRLCDWCHAYGPSDQIGLITVSLSSRHTVGMLLCLDLSCSGKLESISAISGKNLEKMTLQLCEKIGRFYDELIKDDKTFAAMLEP